MRIKFNFTPNTSDVPVNHQSLLNSYIHKCLGYNNEYHDTKSDYNISSLIGGTLNKEDLTVSFNNGGYFVVSSLSMTFINKLMMGILLNPNFTHGMTFSSVDYINENFINGWNHFNTLSPFIIKEVTDNKYSFVTLQDDDFVGKTKRYLVNKLSKIDPSLDLSDFDININDHEAHRVRKVMVKNVINKANKCHISIHTNKKVAELLYNIGIGQSTGSGFGAIYKTENHSVYR